MQSFQNTNGYRIYPSKKMFEEVDAAAINNIRLLHKNNRKLQLDSSTNVHSQKEEAVYPNDGERGNVLRAAKVIMNMLDVTMPDTLTEGQKNKVILFVDLPFSLLAC